jgi:uncharacterized membrane protein YfcA
MNLPAVLSDPYFYLLAVPAIILIGVAKGGFAGGFGSLGVPLMSLVISPVQAAAIILPLLCAIDWWGIRVYRGAWDARQLKIMIPGALLGIGVGAALFGNLSDKAVLVLVGTIAVTFALNSWLRRNAQRAAAQSSTLKGGFWGAVAGLTSFTAHAGGPPSLVYLLPLQLPKVTLLATVSYLFLVINMVKLAPYAWLGQFNADNLIASAILLPLVPLGVHLGRWLQGRVNQALFYKISEVGLLLTGMQLIYRGLSKL